MRPLYTRAAKDNIGSIRVLEKCDFVITGDDKGYAAARDTRDRGICLHAGKIAFQRSACQHVSHKLLAKHKNIP